MSQHDFAVFFADFVGKHVRETIQHAVADYTNEFPAGLLFLEVGEKREYFYLTHDGLPTVALVLLDHDSDFKLFLAAKEHVCLRRLSRAAFDDDVVSKQVEFRELFGFRFLLINSISA